MGIGTGLLTDSPARQQARNDEKNDGKTSAEKPPSLERETGIEPASLAWKARVLPLNYSRFAPSSRPPTSPGAKVSLVEEAGFEPA